MRLKTRLDAIFLSFWMKISRLDEILGFGAAGFRPHALEIASSRDNFTQNVQKSHPDAFSVAWVRTHVLPLENFRVIDPDILLSKTSIIIII
jgi:hypothetical protein